MENSDIASVSWPDHLVFGEGDGRLDTTDSLRRRFECWRRDLNAGTIHWREVFTRSRESRWYASPDNPLTQWHKLRSIAWNDLEVVPQIAHEFGLTADLYVSILDEGRPLASKRERQRSYHNPMHGQHVTWQTRWSRAHPEYTMVDRTGSQRQWGVLCYAYPEVRQHMCQRILALSAQYGFDGVFLCLRSQCKPAAFADLFGFNQPICEEYQQRYGRHILQEDFDLQLWSDLLGTYLTRFLRDLRPQLLNRGLTLTVGIPRGDILGPPMGNWTLQWRDWVADGLVDGLVIDQDSSRCPSMWHDLWPMFRGYGYRQNYVDGYNTRSLMEDLRDVYGPALAGTPVRLYVARQWSPRCETEEATIRAQEAVCGLVFSTFRFDNPAVIDRGDFQA